MRDERGLANAAVLPGQLRGREREDLAAQRAHRHLELAALRRHHLLDELGSGEAEKVRLVQELRLAVCGEFLIGGWRTERPLDALLGHRRPAFGCADVDEKGATCLWCRQAGFFLA